MKRPQDATVAFDRKERDNGSFATFFPFRPRIRKGVVSIFRISDRENLCVLDHLRYFLIMSVEVNVRVYTNGERFFNELWPRVNAIYANR